MCGVACQKRAGGQLGSSERCHGSCSLKAMNTPAGLCRESQRGSSPDTEPGAPTPSSAADPAQSSWSSSDFDLSHIRLIVYQDCERRGRQVLFDSRAVREIDASSNRRAAQGGQIKIAAKCSPLSSSGTCTIASPGTSSGCQQHVKEQLPKYQYTRPASDVNMLGEMMFGSVAMSYKGSTLKIHYIRSPPQLMISKVFSARVGSFSGSTTTLQDSFECINQETNSGRLGFNLSVLNSCRSGSNLESETDSVPSDEERIAAVTARLRWEKRTDEKTRQYNPLTRSSHSLPNTPTFVTSSKPDLQVTIKEESCPLPYNSSWPKFPEILSVPQVGSTASTSTKPDRVSVIKKTSDITHPRVKTC